MRLAQILCYACPLQAPACNGAKIRCLSRRTSFLARRQSTRASAGHRLPVVHRASPARVRGTISVTATNFALRFRH